MAKLIHFKSSKKYLLSNPTLPKPIKVNIPKWFKELEHTHNNLTVKGCMPFLDTLTTGYVLSLPQDFILRHNVIEDGQPTTIFQPSVKDGLDINLNRNGILDQHPREQFLNSPLDHKNLNLSAHKILNPWIIKTPPGYSCLFVPPLNNTDDRFSIIPGIVDTDIFKHEINFPFIVNGDKYPTLDTVLQKDLPYVQIIPFKRDNWISKVSEKTENDKIVYWEYLTKQFQVYKNKIWHKKSWK